MAAQFQGRMIGLKDGRVIAAGTAEMVLTSANLQAMYGIKAEVN
jgi:ABC-type hemin transport system ATPase subunit